MTTELLRSVLLLVIAFALKWFLQLIGVEIDEVTFNTIVAAFVAWVLTSLGIISIHPPYAGRDFTASGADADTFTISIHPPYAGRDTWCV